MFLAKTISLLSNIRKPTRQPIMWAALAYASGIVCGVYEWRPEMWWVAAATAFVLAALYFARRRWWLGFPLALGALVFAGALAIQLRNACVTGNDGLQAFATGEQVTVTAHVTHGGETPPAGPGGVRQMIDVETEEVSTEEQTKAVLAGMRVNIYARELEREYDDGTPVPMRV